MAKRKKKAKRAVCAGRDKKGRIKKGYRVKKGAACPIKKR